MRAAISEPLQAYLRQRGSTVLTITLKPIRCCGSTVFEVLVDPHAPKHLDRYASFAQDGLYIYYSPQLGRRSELLELDYVRTLFGSKPVMTGPEDLVASVLTGHLRVGKGTDMRQASLVSGTPLVALDLRHPCVLQ